MNERLAERLRGLQEVRVEGGGVEARRGVGEVRGEGEDGGGRQSRWIGEEADV